MACLQICREISFKLKRGILLSWQNKYPHINPNLFLRTKILENLILEKYLISLAGTLSFVLCSENAGLSNNFRAETNNTQAV